MQPKTKTIRVSLAAYELLRQLSFKKRRTIMNVVDVAINLYAGKKEKK